MIRDVQIESVHPLRLRLLLEIERTGSISAAASMCAIAQPSASMHLRTLEMAIGHRLVSRNGRGSSLTPAGKVIASHAARVLAALDGMRHAVDALEGRGGSELTVAASLAPSVVLLPRVFRQFSDRYPNVSISLRTLPSETVVREIVHGRADIGIAGHVPAAEPVPRRQILSDELVGVAGVGFVRPDGGHVDLAELARHSLLLGPEESSTRQVTERCLARAGYRPARVWVFDSYEAIKSAVADGLGVSFISRLLAREELDRGELVAFRVSGVEHMERPIHVFESGIRQLPTEAAAFIALLDDAPWSTATGSQAAAVGA